MESPITRGRRLLASVPCSVAGSVRLGALVQIVAHGFQISAAWMRGCVRSVSFHGLGGGVRGEGGVHRELAEEIQRNSLLKHRPHHRKTMVRNCGVDGLSSDDVFLTRCWVEYFGGMQKDKFSFRFRAEKRRAQKFPLSGGSKTIHCHLKGSSLAGNRKRRWKRSIKVLRSLPRLGRSRGGGVVAGAGGWRKFLGRRG